MNKFIVFIAGMLFALAANSQEYINTQKLIGNLEKKVNDPSFDIKSLDAFYSDFHVDKSLRKVAIKTLKPLTKELNAVDLFEQRMPTVYMFLQVYESSKLNRKKINGAGTAYPISEDGHFVINYHMIEELGVGQGDPSKIDKSIHLMLADYAGNYYRIDSVLSYSKEADIAILKANLNGKKIVANPIGTDLKAGSDVFVISHPRDYFYYYTSGRVARMTESNAGIMSRKMEIILLQPGGAEKPPNGHQRSHPRKCHQKFDPALN